MENLKDLLQPERVVEVATNKETVVGFVDKLNSIRIATGFMCIDDLSEDLESPIGYTVTKIFSHALITGFDVIWDRSKDFIDWSKVEVDTKVLVKNYEESSWSKRHFAKYENGKVYTYDNGNTSFTTSSNTLRDITSWNFVKLYREEDKES